MFLGFNWNGDRRLIPAKYQGTCIICSRPVEIGDQIYWQKKEIIHQRCFESQKKFENSLQEVLEKLFVSQSMHKLSEVRKLLLDALPERPLVALPENIEIYDNIWKLIELRDYNAALRLVEKATSLHPENPLFQIIQAVILANLKRKEEAKKIFDNALPSMENKTFLKEDAILNFFVSQKIVPAVMEHLDGFEAIEKGKRKRAKKLLDIIIKDKEWQIFGRLIETAYLPIEEACKELNGLLELSIRLAKNPPKLMKTDGSTSSAFTSGNILFEMAVNSTKFDRLTTSDGKRDEVLGLVKEFSSPHDPELLLWYVENFYLNDDANKLGKLHEKDKEFNVWYCKEKDRQNFRLDGATAMEHVKAHQVWNNPSNWLLLIRAEAEAKQFPAACDHCVKFLELYGPEYYDKIFGIMRGNLSTDLTSPYDTFFTVPHMELLFASDQKEKAMELFIQMLGETSPDQHAQIQMLRGNATKFLSEKLIGSKANLSILERLESSIKGKDERNKFYNKILEKDPTNLFALGKIPLVKTDSGEEGQIMRILEKMPTDDGFLKLVEGNNIEYKESWYLSDEDKNEIEKCDPEYLKQLKESGKEVHDHYTKLAKLNQNERIQCIKTVEQGMQLHITKSVCAFLNTGGGELYFGVAENESADPDEKKKPIPVGIENDVKKAGSLDGLKQKIREDITKILNYQPNNMFAADGFIQFSFKDHQGKKLLKLTMKPINQIELWPSSVYLKMDSKLKIPVYTKDGMPVTMRREDNSNKQITGKNLTDWARQKVTELGETKKPKSVDK